LALEDGTDSLCRNVGKELPLHALYNDSEESSSHLLRGGNLKYAYYIVQFTQYTVTACLREENNTIILENCKVQDLEAVLKKRFS